MVVVVCWVDGDWLVFIQYQHMCLYKQEASAVLTGSYDRSLRIWDLRSNNRDPIQVIINFGADVVELMVPACCEVNTRCTNQHNNSPPTHTHPTKQTLSDFRDSVTRIFVADGPSILATSVDGCLRKYDLRTGRVEIDDCHEPLSSLCLSYDGQSSVGVGFRGDVGG